MDRPPPASHSLIASALAWWEEAGVDTLVAEEPRNWLAPQRSEPAEAAPSPSAEAMPNELGAYRDWLARNGPWQDGTGPLLLPSGDAAAKLMVLVDMPGREDVASGHLLSGPGGLLFDRMLAAIGLDRQRIYLSALSWRRVPGGRLGEEAGASCARFARHHVALAAPQAVLLMGDACARALLGLRMSEARGAWHALESDAGSFRALVTLPPSLLLEQSSAKAFAWADLRQLIREFSE